MKRQVNSSPQDNRIRRKYDTYQNDVPMPDANQLAILCIGY